MNKNSILNIPDIISEAANGETENFDSLDFSELVNDFRNDVLDSATELEEEVAIHPQAVPVYVSEEANCNLVELDELAKFMESWDISDPMEAIEQIAEANHIGPETIGLLIESNDYYEEMIEEAKSIKPTGFNRKKKDLKKSSEMFKNIYNKGLKVFKKKSGKKSKKKK